ncbi:hypothetical protein [Uliginosibacterium gangwonense]|uniref:hypothetical protein n=1 Tax=Uliginosibacterium gangwonense TaxID=392736 RepID=UPI00037E20CC|nr:hypothetical protein [Uliginosibacterium gangwonense]
MPLLNDLTSKNAQRTWIASNAVRHLRDKGELAALAQELDHIRECIDHIEFNDGFRGYFMDIEFALHKLEHVRRSHECICSLYLTDDLFNPVEEARQGNIDILKTVLLDGKWVDHYECRCVLCGAQYSVEENEYDHRWWAWRLLRNADTNSCVHTPCLPESYGDSASLRVGIR